MLALTPQERATLDGLHGPAAQRAMRVVAESARLMGAGDLVEVASAHVDGCLFHGPAGVAFAELLVAERGHVAVPTTLNVGALDRVHAGVVRLDGDARGLAERMAVAYEALGCRPTWTCAPYQAGHRPAAGTHVAWGESNAIAFVNSVLGARTARYGDFLDICCALAGRAPRAGLHLDAARHATVVVDASALPVALVAEEAFYPVLGAWLGRACMGEVPAIQGLPADCDEDRLKALGAAAASTGAIGLFHVVGRTPEAPDLATACGGHVPAHRIVLDLHPLQRMRLEGVQGQNAEDRLRRPEDRDLAEPDHRPAGRHRRKVPVDQRELVAVAHVVEDAEQGAGGRCLTGFHHLPLGK